MVTELKARGKRCRALGRVSVDVGPYEYLLQPKFSPNPSVHDFGGTQRAIGSANKGSLFKCAQNPSTILQLTPELWRPNRNIAFFGEWTYALPFA
jgi:hypothetical protein